MCPGHVFSTAPQFKLLFGSPNYWPKNCTYHTRVLVTRERRSDRTDADNKHSNYWILSNTFVNRESPVLTEWSEETDLSLRCALMSWT